MRRLAALALFVLTLVAACMPHASRAPDLPRADPDGISVTLVLHGDVDFTAEERADVERAAKAWFDMSSGRITILPAWDLDFGSLESLRRVGLASAIVRANSDTPVARQVDEELGAKTLAITTKPLLRVAVWMDRVERADFYAVVLHELGHVAGLEHTGKRKGDVMSPVFEPGAVAFSVRDLALCRAAAVCP